MASPPFASRRTPDTTALYLLIAGAMFAVLALEALIAWSALRYAPDTAAVTIAETASYAIGAISGVLAAGMLPVAIALRYRQKPPPDA